MWRTPPFRDGRSIAIASVWLLLYGPLALGLFVPIIAIGTGQLIESIGFYLYLIAFSPIFAIPAILAALPFAILAARTGWAGWATAVAAGTAAGSLTTLMWGFEKIVLMFAVFGFVYGGTFWLVLRKHAPQALGLMPKPD
jgi:hypothetical protein